MIVSTDSSIYFQGFEAADVQWYERIMIPMQHTTYSLYLLVTLLAMAWLNPDPTCSNEQKMTYEKNLKAYFFQLGLSKSK